MQRYRISNKEVITSKSESSKQPACDLFIPTPLRVRKRVQQVNNTLLSLSFIFSGMVTQIIIPGFKDSQNRDPSLVLIELQGLLESDQPDLRGAHVGELEQDSKASGKVYLSIGHHKLEGKKAKLSKPLAVIAKRCATAHQDTMDLDHPESLIYDVVRIIEEKFVFVSRPSLLVQEDLRGLMKV